MQKVITTNASYLNFCSRFSLATTLQSVIGVVSDISSAPKIAEQIRDLARIPAYI